MTSIDQTSSDVTATETAAEAAAGETAAETAESPATEEVATREPVTEDAVPADVPADATAEQGAGGAEDSSSDEAGGTDASSDVDSEDGADSEEGADDGEENPLDVEAEVAADYLEELLDIADLDGDIDTYIDGDRAHVSIVSESTVLVGRDGEVLDALQELTRLAVLAETGQRSRLMLDVAGYRAQRRGELIVLAGDAVQEAKDTAEPVHLSAMNPFERKIVHDAVAAAGLTSESEGEEPRRHVVVLPSRA